MYSMDHKDALASTTMASYSKEYTSDPSIPSFPTAIKASYNSSWSKLLCSGSKTIHLSPSPSNAATNTANQPQTSYKVSLPNGFYGSMILDYTSPKSTSPLARASPEGRRGYDVLLPGSIAAESLRRQSRKNKWVFALPVGIDGEVETFEWRRSRRAEIKQLGASWRGWKLVRMGRNSRGQHNAAEYLEEDEESLPRYSSEDEKHERADSVHESDESGEDEIVAVWAKTGCWTSLHDVGEFAFHGSGAGGELGQRFAVMAVMTALCIWQKAMRDQATAGAVSAATSVTSVTVS
ncbi:hypothetical protein Q7P35_006061 [Cladosporium inversicolor]